MDVKIVLNLSTAKEATIFHQVFQCLQYHHLKTENNHDAYRGKNCMIKFYESLREHAIKIINFKKRKMKSLAKEQQESYQNAKIFLYLNMKL